MTRLLALVSSVTFAFLGLVHLYWALGGARAKTAAIPEVDGRAAFAPGRPLTLLVALALGGAALLVLSAGGVIGLSLPRALGRALTTALALVLLARAIGDFRLVGFFKQVRGSRFASLDTRLYSPLCLLLGLAAGWIALDAP